MRLTPKQVTTLISAAHQSFGKTASLWLFGSRVDDGKRGGDIDLYVETDLESGLVQAKLDMRSLIWNVFGDQKIDILVRSRKEEMSPMHKIAKESGVELK